MLALTTEQQAALAARHVMRRLFIYCDALALDGVTPAPVGFWDDVGTVTVEGRTYVGSGTVISVGSLSFVGDMSIPGLSVTISGIDPTAALLVRGETVGQRAIELKVGIFDVDTRDIIGDLVPRFIGKVDDIEIQTPQAGGNSTIVLTCESTSRALTISRYDTRSDACQRLRDPSDGFYSYASLQRDKPVYFGRRGP